MTQKRLQFLKLCDTYIPTPTAISSIFFSIAFSTFPQEKEYSNMKASRMNATKILQRQKKNITLFPRTVSSVVCVQTVFHAGKELHLEILLYVQIPSMLRRFH